ncbi:hypothetical protein QD712_03440 [Streptomyces acidiscabies]|uniref:hypothetical protein n=1 Tax=Streptomyces acidiscabies TaxID=42234 RepID=UPI0030CCB754
MITRSHNPLTRAFPRPSAASPRSCTTTPQALTDRIYEMYATWTLQDFGGKLPSAPYARGD